MTDEKPRRVFARLTPKRLDLFLTELSECASVTMAPALPFALVKRVNAAEKRAREAKGQATKGQATKGKPRGQRLGQLQARLAAQGTDLLGSPIDLLGDTAAAGPEDAHSLRYQSMRDAWENRVRGASRQAQARYYETAAGNVDPTLGIVKSLIS